MKKKCPAVMIIMCFAFIARLFSGCAHGNIKDEGGMLNPYEQILEALFGDWVGDGWNAKIDGYSLTLVKDGSTVLDGKYNLISDSDDKAELELYDKQLGAFGTVTRLYYEAGRLYLDFAHNASVESVAFTKSVEAPD